MRLFLGLSLPDDVRAAVVAARSGLALDTRDFRLVREEALHVTIRFFGEVDTPRSTALGAAWRAAAKGTGPIPLTLEGFGVYPHPSRTRVVWLAVRDRSPDEALSGLARRIDAEAGDNGLGSEQRPFSPHVTIARARERARPRLKAHPEGREVAQFVADRLVLFSSRLDRGGARYVEESSYSLVGDDA
jgi:RNA 2',3'-cyclic 3'-phosphodiesterase